MKYPWRSWNLVSGQFGNKKKLCRYFWKIRIETFISCKSLYTYSYPMRCKALHLQYFVGNKAKGQISKRVFPKNKARQIFWKTNMSYPLIHWYVENLACYVFLKHPFWDSPFCLITDDLVSIFRHKFYECNECYEQSLLLLMIQRSLSSICH